MTEAQVAISWSTTDIPQLRMGTPSPKRPLLIFILKKLRYPALYLWVLPAGRYPLYLSWRVIVVKKLIGIIIVITKIDYDDVIQRRRYTITTMYDKSNYARKDSEESSGIHGLHSCVWTVHCPASKTCVCHGRTETPPMEALWIYWKDKEHEFWKFIEGMAMNE